MVKRTSAEIAEMRKRAKARADAMTKKKSSGTKAKATGKRTRSDADDISSGSSEDGITSTRHTSKRRKTGGTDAAVADARRRARQNMTYTPTKKNSPIKTTSPKKTPVRAQQKSAVARATGTKSAASKSTRSSSSRKVDPPQISTPPYSPRYDGNSEDEDDDDEDDDEEIVHSTPKLEQQLSLQILANAANYKKGEPTNDDPPAGSNDNELDEFVVDDDDDNTDMIVQEQDVKPSKVSSKFFLWVAVSAAIVGLAAFFFSKGDVVDLDFEFDFDLKAVFGGGPQCYLDSGTGLGCDDTNLRLVSPCPMGGVCQDGKLVGCSKLFYDINSSGNACKQTAAKQQFHDTLVKTLKHESMKDRGCKDTPWDFIDYSVLRQTAGSEVLIDPSEELVDLLVDDGFGVEWVDSSMHLQLPTEYRSKPPECLVQDGLETFFSWLGGKLVEWVWNTLFVCVVVVKSVCSGTFAFAIQSLAHFFGFVGVALMFVLHFLRQQNQKKKLAREASKSIILEMLKKKNGKPIPVDSVRDEAAKELFPHSKRQQQSWKKNVWPEVKKDMNKDSYVKTSHMNIAGKPAHCWKITTSTGFAE